MAAVDPLLPLAALCYLADTAYEGVQMGPNSFKRAEIEKAKLNLAESEQSYRAGIEHDKARYSDVIAKERARLNDLADDVLSADTEEHRKLRDMVKVKLAQLDEHKAAHFADLDEALRDFLAQVAEARAMWDEAEPKAT